jgi:hypothetical protein
VGGLGLKRVTARADHIDRGIRGMNSSLHFVAGILSRTSV